MKKRIVSILLCVVLVFALSTIAFAADLAITKQPMDQTAAENETVTFSVAATGTGLRYRWQYRPAGSDTWTNAGVTGCKTDVITVVANVYRDGQAYRCVVTDASGKSVSSAPAILTLAGTAELAIQAQPHDVTASVGDSVTMHVQATGVGLSYQWQYCARGGEWTNSGLDGRLSDTLTIPVTNGRNGQSYRCIVKDKDGHSVISDAAVLTVEGMAALKITQQPADVSGAVGDNVLVKVIAEGAGLSYQWQYSSKEEPEWTKCGLDGRESDTLVVPVTKYRDGVCYRCVITDAAGEQTVSQAAKLTVIARTAIEITAQPQNVSAELGKSVQIFVKATGDELSYQWQFCEANSDKWSNCGLEGRKTDTLTIPVTEGRNGMAYRCVITDVSGNVKISDTAHLHVAEPQPPVADGFTVTFVDDDGSVLATESVKSGERAKLPANPAKEGFYFAGWEGEYKNVTSDRTVKATYVPADAQNIFVIDSVTVSKGGTATVVMHLRGNVKVVDYDMELDYDKDALEVTAVSNRKMMASAVNHKDGTIYFNFSDFENYCEEDDVMSITFKVKDGCTATDALIWFSNVKFVDYMGGSDFVEAEYHAIPCIVHIQ